MYKDYWVQITNKYGEVIYECEQDARSEAEARQFALEEYMDSLTATAEEQ